MLTITTNSSRSKAAAPPLIHGRCPIGDPDGRMTADAIADVVTRIATAADQWPGWWYETGSVVSVDLVGRISGRAC
ncbi:hypothetical protein [Microbispora sp. GKU 823]|uniref:hypothetical protein n=1 Tax=Microbispora sp. GKU 823 TaxID=1652100 RepID=UPI0009C449A4|nr:hypothetical protein [Microbispora sp. GKU 823]OPG12560.1 hypothetical protein B1L11_13360 [Microbispora sp. GKU 823]